MLQAPGLKATGLPVPDHAVEGLGDSKEPAVVVHIGDSAPRAVAVPQDLAAALSASPGAAEAFAALSHSRLVTRSRRVAAVITAFHAHRSENPRGGRRFALGTWTTAGAAQEADDGGDSEEHDTEHRKPQQSLDHEAQNRENKPEHEQNDDDHDEHGDQCTPRCLLPFAGLSHWRVVTRLWRMETLINVLHVVGAVFIVGPMAILPMSAMRAIRARNAAQVGLLAKSTNLFSLLSLLVVVLGFALMGMTDPKEKLSMTTPWILISVILYVIAIALSLALVVPTLRRAAADLDSAHTTPAASGTAGTAVVAPRYPAIAAGSGIVSLLLVAVVVLMVWRP